MIRLYQAGSLTEAQLLVDALSQRGIRTYIKNEALQGMLGELPLSLRPEVCIMNDADLERAQVVLDEYRNAQQRVHSEDLQCELCGEWSPSNFELCWKCRTPFPDAPRSEH